MPDQILPPASAETLASVTHRMFVDELTRIAAQMRCLAAGIDQRAAEVADGTWSHAKTAGTVQHATLWGLANLSLDRLPDMAADADRAANAVKEG